MSLSETKKGELAIFISAILWGLFPVITVLSYHSLSPIISLGFSTLFAAAFFAVMLTAKKSWHELLSLQTWKYLLYITLFIGLGYYGLYYYGLKFTTPGNGSLIALLETFFSFLLFNVWRKENFSIEYIAGALLTLVGAAIILFPQHLLFNKGTLLIVLAVILAPFGNLYQQKLRKQISSEAIMFGRNLMTAPIIFLLAKFFAQSFSWQDVSISLYPLLINGILIFGISKILWLESIHRISVTKAISIENISPLFTLLFAYLILRQHPTVWQIVAFVPLCCGVILLVNHKKIFKHKTA